MYHKFVQEDKHLQLFLYVKNNLGLNIILGSQNSAISKHCSAMLVLYKEISVINLMFVSLFFFFLLHKY